MAHFIEIVLARNTQIGFIPSWLMVSAMNQHQPGVGLRSGVSITSRMLPATILWMDKILHHLANLDKPLLVLAGEASFLGFSRWCQMDFGHQ